MSYVGRFAPSPTGPLHFGSLVAAVASYCDAKANNGTWLLRMEDVDKPREMAGAADDILRTLEAFGFAWDDEVIYQSQRSDIYEHYLQHLNRNGFIYACTCSRKEIADSATSAGIEGAIYPKTCYQKIANNLSDKGASNFSVSANRMRAVSWRINVDDTGTIEFSDAIQDKVSHNLSRDVGDFILKRKDGLFAYQLAVVVDDKSQHITHIVRGADLLSSTPRQIYLQRLFSFEQPCYAHIPLAVNKQGEKLSKQTLALPINIANAGPLIFDALNSLGQQPPAEIKNATVQELWRWAINHWNIKKIPVRDIITDA